MKRRYSNLSEVCAQCRNLCGTEEGLKAACSAGGYPHWTSKSELRSKSEICKLCRLVWGARSWRSTPVLGSLHTYACLNGDQESLSEAAGRGTDWGELGIDYFEVRDTRATYTFIVKLHLSTQEDDPASCIVKHRPIISDVGGDHALVQAQTWLSACLSSHMKCEIGHESALPTRLIDLTSDKVRLRFTEGLRGNCICLSYCWGTERQPTTTRENVATRETCLILEELPKTIQDAIIFTQRLNVRYLWIDAICIVQDDDEDRHRQVRSMGDIYKNALVTIAASSSSSVWEGFLQKRRDPNGLVKLPICVSSTSYGSVNIGVHEYYDIWRLEPLHHRGWAFQELLLSRRILIFGQYEMTWRCTTEKWLPSQMSHITYLTYPRQLPPQVFGTKIHPSTSILKQQREVWPSIVSEYSRRKVTHSPDRILACAGIAIELSIAWQDVYMLGLWSRTFVQNLAWRKSEKQEPSLQESLENVPSWSWLSLNYRTEMWPLLRHADAALMLPSNGLRHIVTLQDIQLQSTTIHLRARALAGTALPRLSLETSDRYQPLEDTGYWVDMDLGHSEMLASDISIALLGFTSKKADDALCLLLKPCVTASPPHRKWKRIGRIRIWKFDWDLVPYESLFIE